MDCPALVKCLARGEGKRVGQCVGEGEWEKRGGRASFYDPLDCRSVFLVYSLKPIDLKSPYLV